LVNLLDMPNDEPMQAGGTVSAWGVGCGGAFHAWGALSYEWINGMGVVMYDDEISPAGTGTGYLKWPLPTGSS
jgi:hypothetical protein